VPKYRVTVPPVPSAGETFEATANGQPVTVKVPPGAKSGTVLEIQVKDAPVCLKRCAGGCGLVATWHETHCCQPCKQQPRTHGGGCDGVAWRTDGAYPASALRGSGGRGGRGGHLLRGDGLRGANIAGFGAAGTAAFALGSIL
jgi:hypothetical protein